MSRYENEVLYLWLFYDAFKKISWPKIQMFQL